MAAVGCLEKEIQFQKEAIKEQGVRQAKDRLPTKNIYIRLKTFFFPSKTSRPENRLEYLPVICTCPEPVCSPGVRASVASRMSLPPACCNVRPCRRASTMPRSGSRLAITPAASSLLGTGDARAHPFPNDETKSLPARRRRGPAIRTRTKVLRGEGGPGEGDAFSKAPSSPGTYPTFSFKNYAPASASASPAASSEAGPARGASATERSGICHCPGRGAVSSAFSPT